MGRDGVIVAGVALGALLLLWRQSAQAATGADQVDTSILDANDARAANPNLYVAVDNTVLDANDARAQQSDASGSTGYYDQVQYDELGNVIGVAFNWGDFMPWTESKIPAQYLPLIRAGEQAAGMPKNLLARQLWQESRYNPNAVNSNSGAQGIAQFMPATAQALGINPFDPLQAIPAAASYMKTLYQQTGSWAGALAAYNWGIGNVQRKGIQNAPTETKNYFTQILADISKPAITA